MADLKFIRRQSVIQGTTPRLRFEVLDDSTPAELFQPETLAMSIYDIAESTTISTVPPTVTSGFVNAREDIDVLSFCTAGDVDLTLVAGDTALTASQTTRLWSVTRRIVLFQWTWDSGVKVGAAIWDLSILPTHKPS